jgi:hypothetical protein
MSFNYEPIFYGDVKCGEHKELFIEKAKIAKQSIRSEKSLYETMVRLKGKKTILAKS